MSPLYTSGLFLELPSALQLEVYYLPFERSLLSLNPSPQVGTGSMQGKASLRPNQMQEEPEGLPHLSSWALVHFGHTHMLQGVFRFVPWTREMLASILSDLLASDLSNLHLNRDLFPFLIPWSHPSPYPRIPRRSQTLQYSNTHYKSASRGQRHSTLNHKTQLDCRFKSVLAKFLSPKP